MPSPFPGMDPWLESPTVWPGVHHRLIDSIAFLLAAELRPRFFVDVERRVYVLEEDDPGRRLIVPDVTLTRVSTTAPRKTGPGPSRQPAVLIMSNAAIEVSEPRLVIRTVGGDRAVVTVIEVLSPTNKERGSRGRDEYMGKRREILASSVHLVEIDLLRSGLRFPSVTPLPEGDYYVHVSRAAMRPRGEVFAWRLREELPRIPIPLVEKDPDATLDLGQALRDTYERGAYDVALDYGTAPVPPLAGEDVEWAEGILRKRG